jgi:sphinganine-1-phosphate aldolase
MYSLTLSFHVDSPQGGTESIILAIKAHRDYHRQKNGITRPEMICCVSAHAAVDKVL